MRPKSAAVQPQKDTKKINLIEYVGPSREEKLYDAAETIQKYLRGLLAKRRVD